MPFTSRDPHGDRRDIRSGLSRFFTITLLVVVCAWTSLHAQTLAYVTNGGSNSVSVIDTSSNAVTATIPVGNEPVGVVVSPDGSTAYVTNLIDATISVISTATNTVTATIALGTGVSQPAFLAITPDGKSLYVPVFGGSSVLVVDTTSKTVTANIGVTAGPGCVVIMPDGAHAYVLSSTAVSVIDTSTNTVVGSPIAVQAVALAPALAVTPNGADVYVAGQNVQLVSVIATASNSVVATISIPGAPAGLAVTPDGGRVYVANSIGVVNAIDTTTNTLDSISIPVGLVPFALAVTPDGSSLYVGNLGDNTVSAIATATNTTTGSAIPVGSAPLGIAVANLSTAFAAFTVEDLDIGEHNVSLDGDLTLGAATGGLDFAHNMTTLTVGNFTLTIPAGKIKQVGGQHHFVFHGTINYMKVDFDLKAEHGSSTSFDYSIRVRGVDVDTPNPVTVTLAIGHNSGSTTANQDEEEDDD